MTYLYNIESLGFDKAMEFMARVQSADATPESGAPGGPSDGPGDDTTTKGKATEKCRLKSSTREPESTALLLDVIDKTRDTIDSQKVDAGEAAEEVDDMALAEGEEMQDNISSDNKTPNEVRELLHSLMKKSTILNECRVRIRAAMSKAVSVRTNMFKPFT